MQLNVLAGRECGDCHVCCEALTVDSREFQKHGGCACVHALPDHHCGIYEHRYPVCREFECGWRIFKWVRQSLRPDRSRVLVTSYRDFGTAGELGIIIYLLEPRALEADGLAETAAAAVMAGVPVMVGVLGPPGRSCGYVNVSSELWEAAQARDKQSVLHVLSQARESGLALESEPVILPEWTSEA